MTSKLVYGVGINDGKYRTSLNNKHSKEYNLWIAMIGRCYSETYLKECQTYRDCKVSDNFLNYTYFHEWCQTQVGFGKQGWHLDKDLLSKSDKIYSEDTCAFVPNQINTFLADCSKARGVWPIGVYFHKKSGKFVARYRVEGKKKHLGLFKTPQEAFIVYKGHKEALCRDLAIQWENEIDTRVFNAMMSWSVN